MYIFDLKNTPQLTQIVRAWFSYPFWFPFFLDNNDFSSNYFKHPHNIRCIVMIESMDIYIIIISSKAFRSIFSVKKNKNTQ